MADFDGKSVIITGTATGSSATIATGVAREGRGKSSTMAQVPPRRKQRPTPVGAPAPLPKHVPRFDGRKLWRRSSWCMAAGPAVWFGGN